MSLPNIKHTTISININEATEVYADDGYVFYDIYDYTDDNGNLINPSQSDICYMKFICFPRSVTSDEIEDRIVVVPISTQI